MTSNGDYYGYPKCCINAFHVMLRNRLKFEDLSAERQQVAQHGFVPCETCTQKILKGTCKLHELILPTRQCEKPFPKSFSS